MHSTLGSYQTTGTEGAEAKTLQKVLFKVIYSPHFLLKSRIIKFIKLNS
jgi:hypothetical protein